jgi:hypothetical protein
MSFLGANALPLIRKVHGLYLAKVNLSRLGRITLRKDANCGLKPLLRGLPKGKSFDS